MLPRVDRVSIALSTGDVAISWVSRQALLEELRDHALGDAKVDGAIREAFEDGGTSRPVTLAPAEKAYLFRLLERWALEERGYAGLPRGMFHLRNGLLDDMRGAVQPTG